MAGRWVVPVNRVRMPEGVPERAAERWIKMMRATRRERALMGLCGVLSACLVGMTWHAWDVSANRPVIAVGLDTTAGPYMLRQYAMKAAGSDIVYAATAYARTFVYNRQRRGKDPETNIENVVGAERMIAGEEERLTFRAEVQQERPMWEGPILIKGGPENVRCHPDNDEANIVVNCLWVEQRQREQRMEERVWYAKVNFEHRGGEVPAEDAFAAVTPLGLWITGWSFEPVDTMDPSQFDAATRGEAS